MIQSMVVTSVTTPTPVAKLGSFPASRGLRGLVMQASAGGVFYGGNGSQPLAVPSAAPTDVLPIVHLNDLYLRGAGTVTIIAFL